MILLTCASSNTRLRTLPAFPSVRAFEKASCRRAFLTLKDLEMPVKSSLLYLNVLLNLDVHPKISKVVVLGSIFKEIVLWKCILNYFYCTFGVFPKDLVSRYYLNINLPWIRELLHEI